MNDCNPVVRELTSDVGDPNTNPYSTDYLKSEKALAAESETHPRMPSRPVVWSLTWAVGDLGSSPCFT